MHRILVVATVLCGVTLLALQVFVLGVFFFSLRTAQAAPPPCDGTWNTPGQYDCVVPPGVTSIDVEVMGAQGSHLGGNGGAVSTVLSGLTPGETLHLFVGGEGSGGGTTIPAGGFNGGGDGGSGPGAFAYTAHGGGGGGGSDIRRGGSALADRIVVAGGGGGGGTNYFAPSGLGGEGAYSNGENGLNGQFCPPLGSRDGGCGHGGGGGTQGSGGTGGTRGVGGIPGGAWGNNGISGSAGVGGKGGDGVGGSNSGLSGGGGGGGWYGGGGGGSGGAATTAVGSGQPGHGGGGGGGSSFVNPAIGNNTVYTNGFRLGNGKIIITSPSKYAAPTADSITIPPGWYNGNFQVNYTASGGLCELWTKDGSDPWTKRADVTCGANKTAAVQVPAWCSTTGVGQCGVRVVANPGPAPQQVFYFTGGPQPWTVPPGVTEIQIDIRGAEGESSFVSNGYAADSGPAGKGGRVQATIPVTPLEILELYVGGKGWGTGNGWNGGASGGAVIGGAGTGGGGSDIRRGGNALADRIVVAGGGGGAGRGLNAGGGTGGNGGGAFNAADGQIGGKFAGNPGGGGGAGTLTGGGNGGLSGGFPFGYGDMGTFGNGGAGGSHVFPPPASFFSIPGGGGGGGYYGGGGGGMGAYDVGDPYGAGGGGGGGGSSYCDPDPAVCGGVTHAQGYQGGNGQIIVSYIVSGAGPSVEGFADMDFEAPTIASFTATDGVTTGDVNTPLAADTPSITLAWAGNDAPGGSGLDHYEVWRSPDGMGGWTKISSNLPPATTTFSDAPGSGDWWYGVRALDKALPSGNCITEAGGHSCGGVGSDAFDPRAVVGPIIVQINDPPKVDAGGNQTMDFPGAITLDGAVTDDGLPNPPGAVTTLWSVVSGPGAVTFADPASIDTTASFTVEGVYVLRLEANDGKASASDEITIGPTPYGLVPCGVDRNDPSTPYDETDACTFNHVFLLLWNVVNFALWKLAPLLIVIMVVLSGVIMYFQLGDVNTLVLVKRIWRYVGIGVLVLLFSWLALNFFLGILGFNINIFGQWFQINLN